MKLVVLSSHTPSLFWFRLDMMIEFVKCGHDVTAIGNEFEEKWQVKFAEKGIKYRCISVWRNSTNPLKDLMTILSLKKILSEEQPLKIFAYQAKSIIYGGIVANMLSINEVYPLIAGVGSLFLAETFKARIIRKILIEEYRISMRKCPKVFFQNYDDLYLFVKNRIIDIDRTVVLNGSGVNLELFSVQPLQKEFAFLCIARLIRDKGIIEYLQSCQIIKQLYPSIRCILVGPFDTNPTAIKDKDLQLYIDDGTIEYYGEQKDVRPFIAQCHVFVLPSYGEGTPKTVLEAMACGRAVITTDAPGCRETVVEGSNGYLVPVKNVQELVKKMTYLVNSPESVVQMGKEGRRIAEEKFDVKIINKAIIKTMNL